MKNNEFKEKISKLNEEFEKVNKKVKDTTDTAIIKGMYAKDELDEKIKETKKSLDETKADLKEKQSENKKLFSNHLNKIQESIEEAKAKLEEKKEARDQAKLEKYIDDRLEYSSDCIAFALLALDEAKVSFLEAVEAELEYDELYK